MRRSQERCVPGLGETRRRATAWWVCRTLSRLIQCEPRAGGKWGRGGQKGRWGQIMTRLAGSSAKPLELYPESGGNQAGEG